MGEYFAGKAALVTGAARGIGLAIAEALGRRGARVAITDVLTQPLDEAAARLRVQGIEVLPRVADVTAVDDCRAAVEEAVDRFGGLDLLVNNAGVSIVAPFDECRPGPCRRLFDVNVIGSIQMSLAALEALRRARGHLVFIASVSGVRAIPGGAVYSASKAALRSLAESLRLELQPDGIHVGVVSPGFTPTEASKTVLRGDGTPRPIHRPAHDTPEGVARQTLRLIERRQREAVLTPLGKATLALQRLSPALVDRLLRGRTFRN